MRILVLTETVPYPLDSGGRIKSWHTLAALAREHEVHCHAFARSAAQRDAAAGPLTGVCRSVTLHVVSRSVPGEVGRAARSLWSGVPFTVGRHFSPPVMRRLSAACLERRYDLVYCDHLSMLEYGLRLGLPVVHDAHNVEHRIARRSAERMAPWSWRRAVYRWEGRRLQRYEATRYPACSQILAVSEVDAGAIRALAPGVSVVAVPIAVDTGALPPLAAPNLRPEVTFVGPLDWPPNGEAVDYLLSDIWPRILEAAPAARLTIVGRGSSQRQAQWRAHPSVHFTGWVEDVEPWFRRSRVLIVPLQSGSGMRVKILDAFARGIPVVSTPVGIEGIAARDGEHALVAESPEGLAAATVRLLQDDELCMRLARAARALVLERYDTGVVARQQLEAVARLQPLST